MTTVQQQTGSLGSCQPGQTMTVFRYRDRWFLGNEWGELMEAPFEDVVEWLDTLWDIGQLPSKCARPDRDLVVSDTHEAAAQNR